MKSKNYRILTLSITIALAGLLALQFYWTHESILLADKQFEQGVRKSFHTLNRELEKNEAAYFFDRNNRKHRKMKIWQNKLDSLKWTIHNGIANSLDSVVINDYKKDNLVFKQKIKIESNGEQEEMILELNVSDSGDIHQNIEESIDMKTRQLEHIFIEMMSANQNPFQERIDLEEIENQIQNALIKNGIKTAFNYQLINHSFLGHQVIKQNNQMNTDHKLYKSHLLPGLMGRTKYELVLSFPNKQLFMLRNAWLMLATSIVLILIVVYAFYYSIQTLIKQRKVAELKNDFISNMTHELKTPITSINLACETIKDDNFNFNKESVSNYLNIISEENKRLKTLVNNVLDSSFIESEQLQLAKTAHNIFDLIKDVKSRFGVILENRNGEITQFPEDGNIMVIVDKFHLSNAIFNIIDNAIKYTTDTPKINIYIHQKKHLLSISIKDHGMGIPKLELDKIFTKFHRVSKGNVHNVKGFGLGLSYVKKIVELHGGTVEVTSELNKGSEFKINIPI